MKKYLILILAAAAALVSCGKENLVPENGTGTTQVTFHLSANHPDATKAVKSSWENGDAIFVFFSGAAAPKHLKMTYDGTAWTSAEYDGATQTAGALGLKNGDTGTMRAVFLPFGSDATVSADGTSFTFSETYYAYYLTATLGYTVADNKVSGAFNMVIPDDYVQFFIEDAAATDGAYTLGTDAVIPVGVASIAADGTITETSNKVAGNDMTGYAYQGGYLFSGKLNSSYVSVRESGAAWIYNDAYYFAKTKTADNSRADYYAFGKSLTSHSAIKLPANSNVYAAQYGSPNNGKWVPVGSGITVSFFDGDDLMATPLGTWDTCNYNQSVPEALGSLYTIDAAKALGVTLPTLSQFFAISRASRCSYTWLTVHGQPGGVFKAVYGLVFLPGQSGLGQYWCADSLDGEVATYRFSAGGHSESFVRDPNYVCAVRPFRN